MKRKLSHLILLFALLTLSNLGYGQNSPEATAKALIQAINSNNTSRMERFIDSNIHYSNDDELKNRWVRMFQSIHNGYGQLTFLKLDKSQSGQLDIICKAGKRNAYLNWMKIRLYSNEDTPNKFKKGTATWTSDPAVAVPAGELTPSQIVVYAKEFGDYLSKMDRFSGTVLIAKDGKIIYEDAYGWAKKAEGQKINIETKLNLASITKIFTGIAISQLVQQGKLTYQTRLKDLLSYFKNAGKKSEITIHQLLTHTSGLGDYWADFDVDKRHQILTSTDYYELVKNNALLFDPGTDIRYSNVGVIVLGLVIEALSGQDYIEYLDQNIFKKAGMLNTGFYSLNNFQGNIAEGYYHKTRYSKTRISNHDHKPIHGSAAGGAYSTVHDLLRFEEALFGYELIDKEYVEIMTSPKVELFPRFDYGYLFHCPTNNGHVYIGHDGGSNGVNAEFRMYRDDGYTIIVLSNYDYGADELAGFITDMIVGN